eukprot:COSAG06_NODE_1591_length_8997_cov_166.390874_12_plen_39_part_00
MQLYTMNYYIRVCTTIVLTNESAVSVHFRWFIQSHLCA